MTLNPRLLLGSGLLFIALGVAGYLLYQDGLVPVTLAEVEPLYVRANPEFGEDAARPAALMPAGLGLEAFLANQSDLTVLQKGTGGVWVGQLASGLAGSRHSRRWRISVRPGWRLQDGSVLDAARMGLALRPEAARLGGEVRVVDAATLELRFRPRQTAVPALLAQWRVPGSGPFLHRGNILTRFDGFIFGRAGIRALSMASDPALMESRAWAEGLASGRWAWAVFPGRIAPEDMARVRLAPYDEFHLKDGTVWFVSRKMRRLRPVVEDWTQTRLFGAWQGAMDLPYDPLGM